MAAETTTNQQNKPSIQPATTPRTETQKRRHSTPHQGWGHAQTRHTAIGGGARTSTAPTPAKPTTGPQPQPTQQTTTTQTKHHHRGWRAPTQRARARGGPRTKHRTPHHEQSHKPTQHVPPGGGARTSTTPTRARQTPQTTNTRKCRPYGGGNNSKPTKQAEHPAGYNTTN